ncbi:class I SAM-dependent methyltransferase [Leptolyngbya sp. FACHB-541]|uniref:class I SAM-dependent methyltransferase n=1 Tax=Leptolyngbya sp. FACHB-541 TaxID=2692810 RepID=UPI001686795B|nr:class I SAM-dependent methyltransferase [Leptolyngbya sp. FACHB-541]MBD1999462.1 class I SAM-dependent methyltransferase [Leptolyngbya sp. FACHB-541]
MIEANNSKIDVNVLMQKVQEEVAKRRDFNPIEAAVSSLSTINTASISHAEAQLSVAETFSEVPTKFPDKFNRFPFTILKPLQKFALKVYGFLFKKQRVVNSSLAQALKVSLDLNQRLSQQVITLQAQLHKLADQVDSIDRQTADTSISMDERFSTVDNHLAATDERFSAVDGRFSTVDGRLTAMDQKLSSTNEYYVRNESYIKDDLTQQKRLITLFLEEARKRLPEPFEQEQLQTFENEGKHLLDAFYVAFEDHFRGSYQDISDRLKVYLPLLEQAKLDTANFPILDIGCGRGEWLELLQQSGYTATGLDINRVMLDRCRSRGLEVVEADVIAYLKSLPSQSLSAITGFHIIEHLPVIELLTLFQEILRVLKSGGLIIMETPNPQNVLVGSNNFYMDPTHLNPLPGPLTKFMLENAGYQAVKIMNLNAYADSFKVSGSEIADRFNDYFYGPQDYAVIGYKP